MFYVMRFIDSLISLEKYIGPGKAAAQFAEYFMYFLAGGILYALIYIFLKLLSVKDSFAIKVVFQILSYPASYAWISLLLFFLTAGNLNPVVSTGAYTFGLITVSSFLQIPLGKFFNRGHSKTGSEVFNMDFARDMSMLILFLLTCLIFINH